MSNIYKNQLNEFAEKAIVNNKIDFRFPSGSLTLVPAKDKTKLINATVRK